MATKYRIELTFDDGTTLKTYGKRQRAIARKIRMLNWQTCHLEVVYMAGDKTIGSNAGDYATKDAALLAWDAFNDPDVLAFLGAGGAA